MSSGAVALCKHFERGGASSEYGRPHPFWTLPVGSNDDKTVIAAKILEDMLEHVAWKNVMLLHHGVAVYEIRNAKGYGMRWTLDIQEKTSSSDVEDGVCREIEATATTSKHDEDRDDFKKDWEITTTMFRGFLEPIAGLDHELDVPEASNANAINSNG